MATKLQIDKVDKAWNNAKKSQERTLISTDKTLMEMRCIAILMARILAWGGKSIILSPRQEVVLTLQGICRRSIPK